MARKEDDLLNYKAIQRNPRQKIIIRQEVSDSSDGFQTSVTRSNKTMGRERGTEAIHKISDGRPMPEMESNAYSYDLIHSIKVENMPFEEAFNNDKTLVKMTLVDHNHQKEEPQEEPLDLSNKTLLRKLKRPKKFSMLESYDSADKHLSENNRISSDSDNSSRAVHTDICTANDYETYKLKLSLQGRSRSNPYPVHIPSQVNIPGIGFVPGIFVPGYPAKISKTDHCLEITLTEPSESKRQGLQCLYSSESMHPIASGQEDYQHLAVSSTTSSHVSPSPNLDGFHLNMSSSSFNSGQTFIQQTKANNHWTDTPSTADVSLSKDKKFLWSFSKAAKPLTPDCYQLERTDINFQISRCTGPSFAVNSEQHSSVVHNEENQLPITMDTEKPISLPNIPYLHDNVNEWVKPKHEAIKKRLNKMIKDRTEAPV